VLYRKRQTNIQLQRTSGWWCLVWEHNIWRKKQWNGFSTTPIWRCDRSYCYLAIDRQFAAIGSILPTGIHASSKNYSAVRTTEHCLMIADMGSRKNKNKNKSCLLDNNAQRNIDLWADRPTKSYLWHRRELKWLTVHEKNRKEKY
jgi:hypothetical protein